MVGTQCCSESIVGDGDTIGYVCGRWAVCAVSGQLDEADMEGYTGDNNGVGLKERCRS